MTYIAVIVESPSKCSKIEKYLGPGYKCMASMGHIRKLSNLKAIDVKNNFMQRFDEIYGKSNQIRKLRKFINLADDVLLAADDDREGEAIAWHICKVFDLPVKTTKRIIFHEVTKTALKKAVDNPTVIDMNKVYAQQARQILDMLVGFKLSPILWNKISQNKKESLSAGRCQTPALKLIYENQKEIDGSEGKKVYNTTGYFTSKNIPFALNFNHNNEETMENFLVETVNHEHKYICMPKRETKKKPPKPFTTSLIQQTASNLFRFSPKKTMSCCQKLYEAGYITYMRTDSSNYSKDFLDIIKGFIEKEYGSEYINSEIDLLSERKADKSSKKKGKKGKKDKQKDDNAQEAHEAIRPTNIMVKCVKPNTMDKSEERLYELIWKNTVESCMTEAKYNSITAKISAPEENEYRYSTEQVVFPGWKIVGGYEKENPLYEYLKSLKKNSIMEYKSVVSKVTVKELKNHYTEARLVQLLEKHGIGRPSTFSSLVDKIQERKYVKKTNVTGTKIKCIDFELSDDEIIETENVREFGGERNKLVIQPLGTMVIEFLLKYFNPLFEYEYTKVMEDKLDTISKGEFVWHELCRECLEEINRLSKENGLKNTQREKIKIDEHHSFMIGRYGPVIKYEKDGKTEFKKVKEDIDIDKLKRGEYSLNEIILNRENKVKKLGVKEGKDVNLKSGMYGNYIEWDGNNISLKNIEKNFDEIKFEDIEGLLKKKYLRVITDDATIRNGKFGAYVYYKTKKMKKPKFMGLKGFKEDYLTCDLDILKEWIKKKYKISL